MRTIFILIGKEFRQIFRNRQMIPVIFFLPIVQMLILVYAATMDIKKIDVTLVDYDKSSSSRELVNKISGTGFFRLKEVGSSVEKSVISLQKWESDLIFVIPPNFEKEL